MSTVKVIAIEPFDGKQPGQEFETSERQANQLVGKGLAKMAVEVSNKMKAQPANKANPSPAAGKGSPSSASPAARASAKTTAAPSKRGSSAARRRTA